MKNCDNHNKIIYGDYHRRCHEPIIVPNYHVTKRDRDEYTCKGKGPAASHVHDWQCSNRIVKGYEDVDHRKNIAQIEDLNPRKFAAPIKEHAIDDLEEMPSQDQRMNWNDYQRLNVIHDFVDDLEYDYPSICTSGVIGTSLEGRELKILKISNSDASNTSVWMDAGIHAREWIGPAVNTYVADHIARNFDSLPTSITNKDWFFLPVLNPDGYEYSHTRDRMWRKNRAWYRGRCVGVDLNRNFSFGWGGKGSSDTPTNAFYRGPEAFSEPESAAVRDMITNSGLDFQVYITLHSYGEVIIFPYAYKEELCPDYVRLLEGATAMSKAIYDTNGTIYKVGISKDIMYGAAGTSYDWSYAEAAIPYCYLIELRSKKHKFAPPKEEIEETGNEILNCVKALMEFVDNYTYSRIDEQDGSEYRSEVVIDCDRNETRAMNDWKAFGNMLRCKRCKEDKTVSSSEDVVGGMLLLLVQCARIFKRCRKPVNIWKEERSTMDIMVEGPRAASIAGMLHERDIPYSIAVGDVGFLLEREKGALLTKNIRRNTSGQRQGMDWRQYHRLDTIYAFMDNLAIEYPYLCTVNVIGKSVEGRNLKMLTISNGGANNTAVWIDAAIHPREWISTAVVTYIADRLVRTFNEQPESVTNKDWYILPVLNPDGYEYTHTQDRMWRKNRARYGECVGVDLNRNFSYGWGEKGEEGSSDDPGNIFFRGPKPFSEPETAAVRRVITESSKTFKVFLSFHSYGEVIIFPWGYTSAPCPDYVELLEGGTAMAKAIHGTNGSTYKVGSTKDLMYYAAGTSTDWSYTVANITYSYMIELKGKKHRFLLPKEEIISSAVEVLNGVLRLMDFVDRKCRSSSSCACPK